MVRQEQELDAAEYVIGTMSAVERKAFEDLLAQSPAGAMGLTLQPFWNPGVKIPGPEAKGAIIGGIALLYLGTGQYWPGPLQTASSDCIVDVGAIGCDAGVRLSVSAAAKG